MIERGSNANGDYVRFADGTQICTAILTVTHSSANILVKTWTFPAAFIAAPSPGFALSNQLADYINVSLRDLGEMLTFPTSASQIILNQYRTIGATGTWDATSSAANIRALAVGRWF